MKKNVKLLSLILGTACLILSCTQNEGNDKVVEPENTVNIPAYSSGKVLKNKVFSTGSDVYYEYLTFTSETGLCHFAGCDSSFHTIVGVADKTESYIVSGVMPSVH